MQAELSKGGDSLLSKVMAAFARPTRLVSSQAVSPDAQVDAQLFEADEERQLQAAYHEVASKVDHYKLLKHDLAVFGNHWLQQCSTQEL